MGIVLPQDSSTIAAVHAVEDCVNVRHHEIQALFVDNQRLTSVHVEDFVARVKEETGGQGVDVILDCMGASYYQRNLDSLNLDGRLFIIGFQGGVITQADLRPLLAKPLTGQDFNHQTQKEQTQEETRTHTSTVKNLNVNEDLSQKACLTAMSENNEDYRSLSLSKKHVCLKTCNMYTVKEDNRLCISIRQDILCKSIKCLTRDQTKTKVEDEDRVKDFKLVSNG